MVGAISGAETEPLSKKDQKANERAHARRLEQYKRSTAGTDGEASASASIAHLDPEHALAEVRHTLNVMSFENSRREIRATAGGLIHSVEDIRPSVGKNKDLPHSRITCYGSEVFRGEKSKDRPATDL